MNHWCKHLAVRMWIALLLGGAAALLVLPLFVRITGPNWMIIPGICFFALAYWLTGSGFAAIGHRRISHLMDEAKVWERAGMPREVRQVLSRALNTLDSFLFSPSARKGPAKRLLAQTARFQMAQTITDIPSDDVVEAYLISFPQDREAAVKWLDGVLAGKVITRQTHDIVARIKEAHEQDRDVLQMVARFFIHERCCDLTALQTYRQLIDANAPIPDDLIQGMTNLFLSHSRADRLALSVYLACYEQGYRHRNLLQGIAACASTIRPGLLTKPLLDRAGSALEDFQESDRILMAETFFPEAEEIRPDPSIGRGWNIQPVLGLDLKNAWKELKSFSSRIAVESVGQWREIKKRLRSTRVKRIVKWTALCVSIACVTILIVNTIMHFSKPSKVVETAPIPVVSPVTDPFTIQVAAYLKEMDAKHYVEQLKESGMDAYWTRASGGGKTWYQVRISHFRTKAEAKTFGETLKVRGVIDDYYVANYYRPDS